MGFKAGYVWDYFLAGCCDFLGFLLVAWQPHIDEEIFSVEDDVTLTYRVCHLKSWIHQAEDVITVTWLQTNNVINDIIHLKPDNITFYREVRLNGYKITKKVGVRPLISLERDLTSFSQLAFKVSKAIGLLGALLPGPGGMPPRSEDWLGQGKLNTWEPSFPRYRFTCCCCERWMWYLVGFSRWVWTYWWRNK